jgi:hypothetical protein
MTRDKHGLISSHLDHARHQADRSDISRFIYSSNRHGSCKRVSGALSESTSGNGPPFSKDDVVTTDIIGESHGAGLSVVWAVLCDHRRPAQTH